MIKDDIVPNLLELIQQQIEEKMKTDLEINKLIESISDVSNGYHNAYLFGAKTGKIVSEALQSNITIENLPNGKMYYNIASRILGTVLEKQYERMTDYSAHVQSVLNTDASIGIKSIKPKLNESKISGLVEILSRDEDFEKNKWALGEPVVNFSQTIVDDTIKANAEFHFNAGLTPKIIRTSSGNCCDWCNAVVGIYRYPEVPKDVYRRHKNCQCEVNYYPGDGRKQNAHTKKWDEISANTTKNKNNLDRLFLKSTDNQFKKYLEDVNNNSQSISKKHFRLYNLVPNRNDWIEFGKQQANIKDLAALTAYSGHEFALFSKNNKKILIHGGNGSLIVDNYLSNKLLSEKWNFDGHSHPTITGLKASIADMKTLNLFTWQDESYIIDLTGKVIIIKRQNWVDYVLGHK